MWPQTETHHSSRSNKGNIVEQELISFKYQCQQAYSCSHVWESLHRNQVDWHFGGNITGKH